MTLVVVVPVHLIIFLIVVSFVREAGGVVSLQGRGATFPRNVYNAWFSSYRAYRQSQQEVQIDYLPTGSGDGKRSIIAGIDIDFAGSDSVLSDQEIKDNPDLVMFPMMAGGIVLAYHIPECATENGKHLNLSRDHVVGIFNGTYTSWGNPGFQAINPNCTLPNASIAIVVRSDKSGTTGSFTSALSAFDQRWADDKGSFSTGYLEGTGQHAHWDTDVIKYSGPSNQDVRGVLRSIPYTVTYLAQSDADEFKLNYANIRNKYGDFVAPNRLSIQAAMNSNVNDTSLTPNLVDADSSVAYPIASYSYFIIYKTSMTDCQKAKELIRFSRWAHGSETALNEASTLSMIALSSEMAERVQQEVFDEVTCQGRSVMQLVYEDEQMEKGEEEEQWLVPVAVTVPSFLLLIGGFTAYIVYQRYKLNKMINTDEWDVPIDDIVFFYDEKQQGASSTRSKFLNNRSIRSLHSIGDISEGQELLHQILQWPGKWNSNIVGIRLVEFKELSTVTRDMKKQMLWMRDHVIHTNVVRFYGLTALEKDYFVLGDYCNKGSILNVLQDGKYNLNNDVMLSFAVEIASGMNFLHMNGFVHGMLMCSCCLLDSKWTVKISDWEFHKLLSIQNPTVNPLTALRKNKDPAIGAARDFWTAPELIRSELEDSITPACDVYSFAILLQELFTREDPYLEHADHLAPEDILAAIVNNRLRPEPGSDTPMLVRQVMEIAWSDSPASRPTFEQIVKLLRRGKSDRTSILDNMMDAMETYTIHLEDDVREKEAASISLRASLDAVMTENVPPLALTLLNSGRPVESKVYNAIGLVMAEVTDWPIIMEVKAVREVVTFLDKLYTKINQLSQLYKAFCPFHQPHQIQTLALGLDKETVMLDDRSSKVANLALDVLKMTSQIKPPGKLPCPNMRISAHVGVVGTGATGSSTAKFMLFGDGVDICKSLLHNAAAGTIRISRALYAQLEKNPDFEFLAKDPEWVICNGKEIESYILSGRLKESIPISSDTSVDSGVDLELPVPMVYLQSAFKPIITTTTTNNNNNNQHSLPDSSKVETASSRSAVTTNSSTSSSATPERPVYLLSSSASSSSSGKGDRRRSRPGGKMSEKKLQPLRNNNSRRDLGSKDSSNRVARLDVLSGPSLSRISENSDLSDRLSIVEESIDDETETMKNVVETDGIVSKTEFLPITTSKTFAVSHHLPPRDRDTTVAATRADVHVSHSKQSRRQDEDDLTQQAPSDRPSTSMGFIAKIPPSPSLSPSPRYPNTTSSIPPNNVENNVATSVPVPATPHSSSSIPQSSSSNFSDYRLAYSVSGLSINANANSNEVNARPERLAKNKRAQEMREHRTFRQANHDQMNASSGRSRRDSEKSRDVDDNPRVQKGLTLSDQPSTFTSKDLGRLTLPISIALDSDYLEPTRDTVVSSHRGRDRSAGRTRRAKSSNATDDKGGQRRKHGEDLELKHYGNGKNHNGIVCTSDEGVDRRGSKDDQGKSRSSSVKKGNKIHPS